MEKIRQNIFSIGEVYELQRENQWVEKNRETFREYGYFGGGYFSGRKSLVDRIDYSNDTSTATVRGSLILPTFQLAATGNSNFGYFGGGEANATIKSVVYRINYSNDIATSSQRGILSLARRYLAATGNSNFGYFGGGDGPVSTIDRVNYSNDLSTASLRGPLSLARRFLTATGNSNFGYFGGGYNQTATVQRVNYSNDIVNALVRGALSSGRDRLAATGNSNFGYFGGGWGATRSTIDRINYANDLSTASPRSPLSSARTTLSASGNSNFGYFSGGSTSIPSPIVSTVERINYSNETVTTIFRGPLSSARRYLAATSSASFGGSPVSYLGAPWVATAPYGYFGAGQDRAVNAGNTTNIYPSSIERLDYSNDTGAQIIRSSLQEGIEQPTGLSNDKFGYVCGGLLRPSTAFSPQVFKTYVQRLDYSNDTILDAGSLLHASYAHCPLGNINYGYVVGGLGPGPLAAIQKIDYSNDNATSVDTANTQITSYLASGTSNKNYGYLFGGDVGGSSTYIQRFDFSNDSNNATIRAYTDKSTASDAATGNENYGYNYDSAFGLPVSYIGRLDYSNDTQGSLQRTSLSVVRLFNRATGNSNSGYWAGGANSSAGARDIQKLDFSNDTQILSVRGYLVKERYAHSSFSPQAFGGAPNTTTDPLPTYIRANTVFDDKNTLELPYKRALGSFGYFGGGGAPAKSRIDRIDYSNDTVQAKTRSQLNFANNYLGATSNSNFGYFGGGVSPITTRVERIDYSSDTSSPSQRTTIIYGANRTSATGNSNFGYYTNYLYSDMQRIDYSNDTLSTLTTATFPGAGKDRCGTVSNPNFGYFGGGINPLSSSIVRLNYLNDTAKTSVRGPLISETSLVSASGNNNFGYFGGGYFTPSPTILSKVDRVDYSNDTIKTSARGPLSVARSNIAATGNNDFGYFGGNPAGTSQIDRIDYANDTAQASPRGVLTATGYGLAAVTNARSS